MLAVLAHFLHALFNYTYNRMNVWRFWAKQKLPLYLTDVVVT